MRSRKVVSAEKFLSLGLIPEAKLRESSIAFGHGVMKNWGKTKLRGGEGVLLRPLYMAPRM